MIGSFLKQLRLPVFNFLIFFSQLRRALYPNFIVIFSFRIPKIRIIVFEWKYIEWLGIQYNKGYVSRKWHKPIDYNLLRKLHSTAIKEQLLRVDNL